MENKYGGTYNLRGMDCIGCAATIEKYCRKINGVEIAEVNFTSSTLKVQCISIEAKKKIEVGISQLGYHIEEISLNTAQSNRKILLKNKFKKIHDIPNTKPVQNSILSKNTMVKNHSGFLKIFFPVIILSIVYTIFYFTQNYFSKIGPFLFDALALFCLLPVLKKVYEYFKVGFYFSIEFLMSVAVLGALFIQASQEAAMVMILFQLGEALEGYTSKKASQGIEKLSALIPETANLVLKNGSTKEIRANEVLSGQTLFIKASQRFPADGILLEGETYVDESLLTGESIPLHKKVGDKIVAGALNIETSVKILTTQVGKQHSLARLVQLVQEAQGSKSKTLRTIENFSKYYTPIILSLALCTAVLLPLFGIEQWHSSIYKGLAILLICCPCALIISTPSAIAAGISAASKLGVLIKNATALELIGQVKTMAFDKTGTLTEGKLKVTDIISFCTNISQNDIFKFVVSLEQHSTHPFAKSIVQYAKQNKINPLPLTEAKTISGVGITGKIGEDKKVISIFSPLYATENNLLTENEILMIEKLQKEGKSICILFLEHKPEGVVALQDCLKNEVKFALNQLKQLKIMPVILTGDHKTSANAIAKPLDVQVLSQLMPEQKLKYIQDFSKKGIVAMVGDGINDAPALAAAHVGIAMGEGTDVAVDSAQIVIANKNINSLVSAVRISRKCSSLMAQNIAIAILLKLFFLVLVFMNSATLWMAILADTGATVIVTLNSMRLLAFKKT